MTGFVLCKILSYSKLANTDFSGSRQRHQLPQENEGGEFLLHFTEALIQMRIINHVIKPLAVPHGMVHGVVLFMVWFTVWALKSKRTGFKFSESRQVINFLCSAFSL